MDPYSFIILLYPRQKRLWSLVFFAPLELSTSLAMSRRVILIINILSTNLMEFWIQTLDSLIPMVPFQIQLNRFIWMHFCVYIAFTTSLWSRITQLLIFFKTLQTKRKSQQSKIICLNFQIQMFSFSIFLQKSRESGLRLTQSNLFRGRYLCLNYSFL